MINLISRLKLLPIYLLQKPGGYDFRLYGLMPLIGLVTFLRRRRVEVEFFPFIAIFFISTLIALYANDWLGARRSIQTLCMAGFCSYLIHSFSDKEFTQLAKNSLYLLVAYYIYDFMFGIKSHVVILQTWHTYFLVNGLLNNANYTGLLSAGLAVFFGLNKNHKLLLVACVMVFISQSKTAFFCLLLSSPILLISNKQSLVLKFYAYFLFGSIAISPLLLALFEFMMPEHLKIIINSWTGGRYTIQLSFLELFKDKPFGVGYDRSHEVVGPYLKQGSSIVTNGLYSSHFKDIGAHNTYIKILAELGLAGYILFHCFIFLVLQKALKSGGYIAVAFMAICASQLWLEGLSEFIFYFFIALIFRATSKRGANTS